MMPLASVGSAFSSAVHGPLLLAIPVSVAAGVVSFLSPCVLPLVPGYLSYVTGLSGADLSDRVDRRPVAVAAAVPAAARGRPGGVGVAVVPAVAVAPAPVAPVAGPPVQRPARGRVLVGTSLFVLGFSAVFVSYGVLFGHLGADLKEDSDILTRVLGGVTLLLGLAFLGFVPGLQRELRIHRLPAVGVAGAPLLGVLFGLGWTPCIGPTLGAVEGLAFSSASAGRGALLSFTYCLGLGLPFVLVGLGFRRLLGLVSVARRHAALVTRVGGGLLIALGLLMVTGAWDAVTRWLVHLYSGFTPVV